MNNDYRILDYINGTLPSENEEEFFLELASNEAMRNDIRYYLMVRTTLNENASNFEPPQHLRDNIYKTVSNTIFPKKKDDISKDKKKNIGYFSLGVLCTGLILSLVYFLVLKPGYNKGFASHYTKIENTKPIITNVEIKQPSNKLKTSANYNRNDKYYNNQISNNIDTESSILSSVQSIKNNKSYPTNNDLLKPVDLHYCLLQPVSINLNSISNTSIIDNNLSHIKQSYSNSDYIKLPLNLIIGISGSQSLFFPSSPPSNDNPKFLNNGSVSIYYKFSKYLSIGAEIRKEIFVQRIFLPDTIDYTNNNDKIISDVQKDFLTPSITLMITSKENEVLQPNGKLTFGYNPSGLVLRVMSGLMYQFNHNFFLEAGVEYNNLFYTAVDGKKANSQKLNLVYGIYYQF